MRTEEGALPLPRKILEILSKNDAFLCKIFTIFEMHPVNRGRPLPPSALNPPLAAGDITVSGFDYNVD